MNNVCKLFSVAIVLIAFAQPASAVADENHDKWIDVLSIDWGVHQPGASTTMKDGKYKDKKGRYVVVKKGKVVTRGGNYRKYKPTRATADGRFLPARDLTREQGQKGVESDEIDVKTRAHKPGGGMTGQSRRRGGTVVEDMRDEQDDDDPVNVRPKPEKREGIEPDEIDDK